MRGHSSAFIGSADEAVTRETELVWQTGFFLLSFHLKVHIWTNKIEISQKEGDMSWSLKDTEKLVLGRIWPMARDKEVSVT